MMDSLYPGSWFDVFERRTNHENKVSMKECSCVRQANVVRFFGIPEDSNENVKAKVKKILNWDLGLEYVKYSDIEDCKRVVGEHDQRPRPVVASFPRNLKDKVLQRKHYLNGTGISVHHELWLERSELRQEAVQRFGHNHVEFVDIGVAVEVRGRWFSFATLDKFRKFLKANNVHEEKQ